MGAVTAINLRSPETGQQGVESRRSALLGGVGEALRLYRDVERALAQVSDGDLARLAAAARRSEIGLEQWARRVDAFRDFKRRFEMEMHYVEGGRRPAFQAVRSGWRWPAAGGGSIPFVWETLAFLLGLAASFLVT